MTPPIRTDRLILRRMAATDLDDLLAYRTHPAVLRLLNEPPMSPERAAAFVAEQAVADPGDAGGYLAFAIHHRQSDRMIGEIGMYIQPSPQSSGDIGWIVHPDWQNQGHATEAATAMLAYGFMVGNLHRVTSGCDAPNAASLRIMQKLGMRQEAHYRQSRFINGAWQDAYAYALLRGEWRSTTR